MPMKNPPHIGSFIRTEVILPTGLTVTAAAKVLGVSRPALSNLLNERAELSAEMALRMEKAFGVDMALLMDMQTSYSISRARRLQRSIKVRPFTPLSAVS